MAVKKCRRRARASLKKSDQNVLKNKGKMRKPVPADEKVKKAILIAQEIKFARLLSSNDKVTRDRVLKNLRKWLTIRGLSSFAFTEADFMRLWKGFFYCMWMSDKLLIQEEVAESLSKIVHCFKDKDAVLLYTFCALKTIGTEWYGIDQYRLDKFCMLVRRIIRQTFAICKQNIWEIELIKGISELFETLLTDSKACLGFKMHITEVFLEELSKIGNVDMPHYVVNEFLKPFIVFLLPMDDDRQISHVLRHVFRNLIFQSDVGMDYLEKFRAWRDSGFPAGSIDAMQRIELSDEETNGFDTFEQQHSQEHVTGNIEKPLDPRAGRVNVELPQIPFDAKEVAALLNQYRFHPMTTSKSRRKIRCLIREFTELSEGKMPLGVKEIRLPKIKKKDTDTKSAAIRLLRLENELYSDTTHKKRKKRRHKTVMHEEDESKEQSEGVEEEEEQENMYIENNKENSSIDIDERSIKKRKNKLNLEIYDDLKELDKNSNSLKKEERKTKEKENSETVLKNGCSKPKKDTNLVFVNSNNKSKKKIKKAQRCEVTNVKIPNVIIPDKRKNSLKLNSGKWEVSDNVDLGTSLPLCNRNVELCKETREQSVRIDCVPKTNDEKLQPAWLLSVLKKMDNEKNGISQNLKRQSNMITENSKKRVKIALQRNTAQHTSEYILQIRKSPAIPFDANKKPVAGVLKASPIPSPINPFYKRKML